MDPAARRKTWDLIEKYKRMLIHSFRLCDEIEPILHRASMHCVDNA